MAEPRVQYCTTSDGVSIAYSVIGEGMPLVHMPWFPISHLQAEWQIPEIRRWYERLAEERMLVRHDSRGTGLSERDVTDFSLDARMLDLEAVVDRLNLERFALYASLHSGPVAIAYAVRHPERVSHLVLWCTYARASDWIRSPRVQGVRALVDMDWRTFTETASHAFTTGWEAGELAHRIALLFQESMTQQDYQRFVPILNAVDVTDLLPQVKVPTQVLHRRQLTLLGVDVAKRLGSRIPDARLSLVEGEWIFAYIGEIEEAATAIDEFLGEGREKKPAQQAMPAGGLVTILFTDMEGSTALTQRLGDAKAQELLREHNTVIREALKTHGGSEVKHTGDGIMASFGSARGAVDCAIAIQRALALGDSVRVRIGLNAGEPVAEEQDLFGTSVQLAARVCSQAEGGEILASNVVRELAAGKGFLFADRGEFVAKGFEEPVRVYEVSWRQEAG